MRTFFGVVLLVLGLPLLVAGGVAAVYVGPDDTVGIIDDEVNTDAAVITSDPSVLDLTGPTLHIGASSTDDTETFVGVAHPVHVASYLDGVPVERISQLSWRGELGHDTVNADGETPQVAPAGVDWWRAHSVGAGHQQVGVDLTDEPVQFVISHAEPAAPLTVEFTVDAEVNGLFATALLVAGAGLVLVAAGVLLIIAGRRRKRAAQAEPPSAGPQDGGEQNQPGDDTAELDVAEPTPLRPRHDGGGHGALFRLTGAAGVLVPILGLAGGCAQLPGDADHDAHPGVPAVTPEAAETFFAHYTEVNNEANAERNRDLIAAVETGTLLTSSRMSYRIQQAQDEEPTEPFTVTLGSLAGPQLEAYPMWFFATSEPQGEDTGPGYYLVTREDASSPWRATLSVYPAAEAPILTPSSDDRGVATLAGEDTAARGDEVLAAIVDYAETGSEPENVDVSNAGGLSSLPEHGLRIVEGPEERVSVDRSCTLRDDQVRWLTAQNGAVAMAAVSCTQNVTLDEGFSVTLDSGGYGTIPGETRLTELQITHGVSMVVQVNDDGTAVVVGEPMLPYSMDYTEGEG